MASELPGFKSNWKLMVEILKKKGLWDVSIHQKQSINYHSGKLEAFWWRMNIPLNKWNLGLKESKLL